MQSLPLPRVTQWLFARECADDDRRYGISIVACTYDADVRFGHCYKRYPFTWGSMSVAARLRLMCT